MDSVTPSVLRLLFVFGVGVAAASETSVRQQLPRRTQALARQSTDCSLEEAQFCETEANRYCFLDESAKPKCGNCLPGFVEWRARCIQEEALDLALFLTEYLPQYLSSLSEEERATLLQRTIQFIEEYQNQNPPPPFELGLNLFSADSEEDLASLRGFSADTAKADPVPVFKSAALPESDILPPSIDWVELGAVTRVKDQVTIVSTSILMGRLSWSYDYYQIDSPHAFFSILFDRDVADVVGPMQLQVPLKEPLPFKTTFYNPCRFNNLSRAMTTIMDVT